MAKKRIGILTGGGDVPGLNAVIKSVTYRGSENDIEVIGLRRGWEALTHLNVEDPASRSHYVIPLNRENTRTIDRHGGTVLHSSRTNPSKMQKLPSHLFGKDFPVSLSTKGGTATETWDVTGRVLSNLSALGIEHLIAIGGDDTLSYAAKLNALGVKIIAIPKTMPCFWARCRIYGALHSICDLYPMRHTRVQSESRQAHPAAPRGQASQSEQLCAGRAQRRRRVGGLQAAGIWRA